MTGPASCRTFHQHAYSYTKRGHIYWGTYNYVMSRHDTKLEAAAEPDTTSSPTDRRPNHNLNETSPHADAPRALRARQSPQQRVARANAMGAVE